MARNKKSAPGKRKAADGAAGGKKSKKLKKQAQAQAPEQQKKPKAHGEPGRRAAEAALSRLLGGVALGEFLSEYFEKKPLHVRNDGSHQVQELALSPHSSADSD